MIEFTISSQKPNAHLFNVKMVIKNPNPDGQIVSMPNWIPGSYLFRDYARQIVRMEAYSSDNVAHIINMHKIDNNTWVCEKTNETITIEYVVYAWDLTVEGCYLDQKHGFINGAALFLMPDGKEDEQYRINIEPPNCPKSEKWKVATTLARDNTDRWNFGWYSANSYEELIDHPITIGTFEILEFIVMDVPHYIVISGKQDGDLKRLNYDIKRICETHIAFFNEPAPFNEYLFHLAVMKGDESGGLEHRNSSALMVERESFAVIGDDEITQDYMYMLSLFSHEYFHAWNVKRIKPESFLPYDLKSRNYTTQLWGFEGVTSYYADLGLVRSKVISYNQYLTLTAQDITKLLRTPGRKIQTVAESSFDVWIKYNQPNENSINSTVNYYVKGRLLGLVFDLALRLASNNTVSLDDVMRTLWVQYGKVNKGVPEGKIDEIIVQLGGKELFNLVHDGLYTTKELPFKKLLTQFGFRYKVTELKQPKDLFGKGMDVQAHQKYSFKQGVFGFATYANAGRIYVAQVIEDSPASIAGVSANDEIIAINGIRVDNYSIDTITRRLKVGQLVVMYIFRIDVIMKVKLLLTEPPKDIAKLSIPKNIEPDKQKNIDLLLSKQ